MGIPGLIFDSDRMHDNLIRKAESQASLCSVFANAKRVLILWTLADQERSIGQIATSINASMQCTSQHQHLMKEMGILKSRREGQTIFYRLAKNGLMERCQHLLLSWSGEKECEDQRTG